MKLSKAQTEVMEKAKEEIDFARTHSLKEWAKKEKGYTDENIEWRVSRYARYGFKTASEMVEWIESEITQYAETYKEDYFNRRQAIVLCYCNSRTLAKLEKMGLIEILYDSNGQTFGIDTIKVLNY